MRRRMCCAVLLVIVLLLANCATPTARVQVTKEPATPTARAQVTQESAPLKTQCVGFGSYSSQDKPGQVFEIDGFVFTALGAKDLVVNITAV
jgi:hypothetical protein